MCDRLVCILDYLEVDGDNSKNYQKINTFHFSTCCDTIDKYNDYAGIVVWGNGSVTKTSFQHGIRPGYIFIKKSDEYLDKSRAGQGLVHDGMIKGLFPIAKDDEAWTKLYKDKAVILGGFSIRKGRLKTSSIWLNSGKERHFSNWSCEKCRSYQGHKRYGDKYMPGCEAYLLWELICQFIRDRQKKYTYAVNEFLLYEGETAHNYLRDLSCPKQLNL